MMQLFEELFGPYPFGEYAVVVADEELDVPVEAQGLSCSAPTTWTAYAVRSA